MAKSDVRRMPDRPESATMFGFTVNWTEVRSGSLTYLREKVSNERGHVEFGPVCPLLVEALLKERKAYWQSMAASRSTLVDRYMAERLCYRAVR